MRKAEAEKVAAAQPDYVLVGLIRKAQGIRGEVLVEPLTDSPDVVFAPGSRVFAGNAKGELSEEGDSEEAGGEHHAPTLTVDTVRPHKGGLLIQFEELSDRNSAELWRGRYLLAPLAELPPKGEDEIYLHELTGMAVESPAGANLGTVTAFYELPQGIMLDVLTHKGSVLVPYHPQSVTHADIERRTIVVKDDTGLFD